MKTIILSLPKLMFALFVLLLLTTCKTNSDNKNMNEMSKKEVMLSVIHERKSVRKYLDKEVSQEDINTMIRAGMAAPTGKDVRPWEIIVVNDREKLDQMAEKLPYAKMLSHAPMAFVICGDSAKQSYWYLDCALASQNILLTAEALGLGAVWTAAYPYDDRMAAVIESLNLPENILPLNVIPVGYPDGEFKPKDKFDESKVHYNGW